MLEQETELIKQIIVEATLGSRDSVKLSEILTAELPRGIKAYMTAEVTKLLEEDCNRSQRLAQVAQGLGGTEAAERSVLRTLATAYPLSRTEFLALVDNAVHFTENYVCRPQWTLRQFLFENSDTISVARLARAFEYVVDYAYYRELLLRYAYRKGWHQLSADQFAALLARIDEEVVKQHSPRELALLAKPIYDFLLLGDASMTRPIPLGAVLVFYEDKKMMAVKEYIERICAVRSRSQLSMNELIGILEDFYHVEHAVEKDVRQSEQEIFEQSAETAEPSSKSVPAGQYEQEIGHAGSSEEQPTVHAGETPTVDVLRVPTSELESDVPPIEPPAMPAADADVLVEYARERNARKQAPFLTFAQRREQTEDATASAPVSGDIHEVFLGEQKARIIKKIFKGDENALFIFLASLKNARNWRDAQPYLLDLFEMNQLNHLTPEVIEFTDALHAYYHPELKKPNEVH